MFPFFVILLLTTTILVFFPSLAVYFKNTLFPFCFINQENHFYLTLVAALKISGAHKIFSPSVSRIQNLISTSQLNKTTFLLLYCKTFFFNTNFLRFSFLSMYLFSFSLVAISQNLFLRTFQDNLFSKSVLLYVHLTLSTFF